MIKKYMPGDTFGELALLYNAKRAASIKTTTDCVLWALDRETFNYIIKDSAIKTRNQHLNFLKSVELLQSLNTYEVNLICEALKCCKFKSGEVIIREVRNAKLLNRVISGTTSI